MQKTLGTLFLPVLKGRFRSNTRCRVFLSQAGASGGEFSLSSSSSSKMGFSADPGIPKTSSAVGEKVVSLPGL